MRVVKAIVPAAGLSTRMGGPNKLLLPWEDSTVVSAVVRSLLACRLDVIVVTGRDADEVAEAVKPASVVHNSRYKEGLGATIATGIAAGLACDGYLIALGDMPALDASVIQKLVEEFDNAPPDAIVAPVYENEPDRLGHPVLFSSAYRDELLALTGDVGARAVLRRHADRIVRVPVSGGLEDIDER